MTASIAKKSKMPAVEDRNRQQVEDPEVDADHGHEVEQGLQAELRLLPGRLDDQNRPADVFGRNLALQDLATLMISVSTHQTVCFAPMPMARTGRRPALIEAAFDADDVRRSDGFPEDVLVRLRLRRDLDLSV